MARLARALPWLLIGAVTLLGVKRIALQSKAMLVGQTYPAAVDFQLRYQETQDWFDGRDVYREAHADYPPATYIALWPFVRPWTLPTARLIWWSATMASLAALSLMFRAAVSGLPLARTLAILLPWVASPTAITLGIGQFGPLVLAVGLGALLLCRRSRSVLSSLVAGALLALALAKPTITAPLCLAALSTPAGWAAALIGAALYSAATLAASVFQPTSTIACLTGWIGNGIGYSVMGCGNLATWSRMLGHPEWTLPAALFSVLAASAWLWRARTSDAWLQIGVLAGVARLWTYHYWGDDLLIYLPMIGVLRHAPSMSDRSRRVCLLPVALAGVVFLLPTSWRGDEMVRLACQAATTVALLGLLAVLMWLEKRDRGPLRSPVFGEISAV